MSRKRQVKNGNSLNAKTAVINLRMAANFHLGFVRRELPFGTRQFACRNRAVDHDVVVLRCLLDHSPGKKEWIRTGEDGLAFLNFQAETSSYSFKSAGLAMSVVFSPRRF